jgi:hypothetical protein
MGDGAHWFDSSSNSTERTRLSTDQIPKYINVQNCDWMKTPGTRPAGCVIQPILYLLPCHRIAFMMIFSLEKQITLGCNCWRLLTSRISNIPWPFGNDTASEFSHILSDSDCARSDYSLGSLARTLQQGDHVAALCGTRTCCSGVPSNLSWWFVTKSDCVRWTRQNANSLMPRIREIRNDSVAQRMTSSLTSGAACDKFRSEAQIQNRVDWHLSNTFATHSQQFAHFAFHSSTRHQNVHSIQCESNIKHRNIVKCANACQCRNTKWWVRMCVKVSCWWSTFRFHDFAPLFRTTFRIEPFEEVCWFRPWKCAIGIHSIRGNTNS